MRAEEPQYSDADILRAGRLRGKQRIPASNLILAAFLLLLNPTQHVPRGQRRPGTRYSMYPHHQQQGWLLGWDQGYDKAVARSMLAMGAGSGSGLHQRTRMLQCAVDFRSGALPGGLRHSGHHFTYSSLVAPPIKFQICTRHVQRRDEPMIPQAHQNPTLP